MTAATKQKPDTWIDLWKHCCRIAITLNNCDPFYVLDTLTNGDPDIRLAFHDWLYAHRSEYPWMVSMPASGSEH